MNDASGAGGRADPGDLGAAQQADAAGGAEQRCAPTEPPVVGVVVAGAAARGPFEAGALKVVLPWLYEQKCRPRVLVGTSSGAITAALLAQYAHLGADAGEQVMRVWEQISQPDVFRSVWASLAFQAGGMLAPQRLAGGGLLDTTPLWGTAQRLFDPGGVAENLTKDLFADLAVAATFCPADRSSGHTRMFVQSQRQGLPAATSHAIDYVKTTLEVEHVLASAAIPAVFPPVLITTPADCRGWYIDGGVRLNAPIKPAVALGANRVVVVSSHAVRYPPSLDPTPAGTPRPGLRDAAAQVLHAVLADAMVDDLHRLGRKNQRFQELLTRLRTRDQGATPDDAQTLTGYQCIPYLAVAPSSGQLADIATKVYEKKYGELLSPPDSYWALGKLLRPGGDAVGARELLSYLFFDPTYAEAQVELGRQCAQDAIAQGWQTAPP